MTYKQLDNYMNELKTMRKIVDVYQQVAAIRMRRVKNVVLQNREFYEKLSKVFAESQESYQYYIRLQKKKRLNKDKDQKPQFRKTNGKTLAVFLSANTGLYGEVMRNVFNKFYNEVRGKDWDLAVAGRAGRNLLQSTNKSLKFKYFDLRDGINDDEKAIKEIFQYAINYEAILIYHAFFKTIISQEAVVTSVSKKMDQSQTPKNSAQETLPFLFEPDLNKVLEHFEKEILYSVFNQSVYESSLGKYAARMVSLDLANENIAKKVVTASYNSRKARHIINNRKQIDQVIGLRRIAV